MSLSALTSQAEEFKAEANFAKRLDAEDPVRIFRNHFHLPRHPGGKALYFCTNSLGLQPKSVRQTIEQELEDWAALGAKAHFKATSPWFPYHQTLRSSCARLIGSSADEVVMMNTMTVNLHLMLISFYRPSGMRQKILVEDRAFPSTLHAISSHLRSRGLDPEKTLIRLKPRPGEENLRIGDIEACIAKEGPELALVFLSGVHYYTGQALDIRRISTRAREENITIGWDLAHCVGNIPLSLHLWDVDFAVWCSYKYLNAGPGAVGGCFIHQRHGVDETLPRFAGWWSQAPEKRFDPDSAGKYAPLEGAEGWQISNPSIFALAPLKASLEIFDDATIEALRKKSIRLTGYLRYLIDEIPNGPWDILTPKKAEERGAQLTLRLKKDPQKIFTALESQGVICDFRMPDALRIAPAPLYNSFDDIWRFAEILSSLT